MTQKTIDNAIILAENDLVIRGIVRTILIRAGQEVLIALDGDQAVDLAKQFKARLVLLDIGMPRLNGLLACRMIRNLPNYDQVPIVMLTSYNDERMRTAAMEVGANDFLTKPFRPDVLMAQLALHLGLPVVAPAIFPEAASGKVVQKGAITVWNNEYTRTVSDDVEQLNKGMEILRISRKAEQRS